MRTSDSLPGSVLSRKAVVYVRQSTPAQVRGNLEGQRRQYDLVDIARHHGFGTVEIIDEDLGLSAGGTVARPGFERLIAWLCAGDVGAVLCFEASRVARNGRDWHHILELCGLVGARVIDHDGVYDPRHPNDRLLLGMKGQISEFELGVLRARMHDARSSKAARGELRIGVPVGYIWDRDTGLDLDPDTRVREAVRQIFSRFRDLGSARQVLLALTAEQLCFPRPSDGSTMVSFDWTPIRYGNVISVLKNPFYAGAYAYGKNEIRTEIVDGHVRKTYGHAKPMEEWEVLLKDHHEGYIDRAEFERNQTPLAANSYGRSGGRKSGRGGQHSQLRVRKPRTGEHGSRTSDEALAVMRNMAGRWSDDHIAASLNRMGMRTGQDKTWTAKRVSSIRRVNGIHAHFPAYKDGIWCTMLEAAKELGVASHVIRRLIKMRELPARQVVPGAPWQIKVADLHTENVAQTLANRRRRYPHRPSCREQMSMFSVT